MPGINYEDLRRENGEDGSSLMDMKRGFLRYSISKLALIYLTLELDKQLRSQDATSIKVNACHPGIVAFTALGSGTLSLAGKYLVEPAVRFLANLLGNTAMDAAKTQVYLAAGREVRERDVHGEYWMPVFSWNGRFCGCEAQEIAKAARDEGEWAKLWSFCEEAVRENS
jgi:NAD(P)-dependent dehydrogenase (short-subunit alcohol dehydrogenase family)